MKRLILFISVLLLASCQYAELEKMVAEKFEEFDMKNAIQYIATNEEISGKLGSECFETLQKYANNFETYAMEIGMMALYSGRDLNDLGRFTSCNELEYTRYMSLSIVGLPIGFYLGI